MGLGLRFPRIQPQAHACCIPSSAHSLKLFREQLRQTGLMPVMGGAAPAKILDEERNVCVLVYPQPQLLVFSSCEPIISPTVFSNGDHHETTGQ
jgi:hypothetical protein